MVFLKKIGLDIIKIPSGEITNIPLLEFVANYKFEVILSTGMSSLSEIKNAIEILKKCKKLKILHCNSAYPTPFEDANLNSINFLSKKFRNLVVGYSDHTLGIEASIAAVAMGAKIIEKHFTISKKSKGPDHHMSLEPNELKKMIESIRNVESSIGKFQKKVSKSEKINIVAARKSIVAKYFIKKGEIFTFANITTKRPQNGILASKWHSVIHKKAKYDFKKDDLIKI